jgi:hypothetical protein
METQMRFRFIDATAEKDGGVTQVNYYLDCSLEDDGKVYVVIYTIPHHNIKLNTENAKHFVEAFEFEFNFLDVKLPDTRTVYFQIGNTDELDDTEVFVDHEREGFKWCENEMQNFIISNQSKWKQLSL